MSSSRLHQLNDPIPQVRGESRELYHDATPRAAPTEAPTPRRRKPRKKPTPKPSLEDTATTLFTERLMVGAAPAGNTMSHGELRDWVTGRTQASGVVPYAQIPEAVRQAIPMDQPPIGWDVSSLKPEESYLLKRLLAQSMTSQGNTGGVRQ